MLAAGAGGADSSFVAPLAHLVEPWQSLYSDHTLVSTAVIFVHLASLVASAGMAFAIDRAVMQTRPDDHEGRARRLDDLSSSHRAIITALAISFGSGLLLLLADLEAFVVMKSFWVKMTLIALLAGNALLMMRRERELHAVTAAPSPAADAIWSGIRRHAATSITLWFAIVLAGTAMSSS